MQRSKRQGKRLRGKKDLKIEKEGERENEKEDDEKEDDEKEDDEKEEDMEEKRKKKLNYIQKTKDTCSCKKIQGR